MMENKRLLSLQLIMEELQRQGILCDMQEKPWKTEDRERVDGDSGRTEGGERPDGDSSQTEGRERPAGIRFWNGESKKEADPECLLLCVREKTPKLPQSGMLVLLGAWREEEIHTEASYIRIRSGEDLFTIVNLLEEIFASYARIAERMQEILRSDNNLIEICKVANQYFQTAAFIHDEYYFILACIGGQDGKTSFEYNAQMEKYMQDSKTLTLFQTSEAYKETMKTTGGQIWDSDYNEDLCMYCNIWLGDTYKGRMIVTDPEPTRGKLQMMTYLGEVITQAALNKFASYNQVWTDEMRHILISAVHGHELDLQMLEQEAKLRAWSMHDYYLCGKMTFVQETMSNLLVYGICNEIQSQVRGSYTCFYNHAIYILVNMTQSQMGKKEFRKKMSYIIRESMLHIGVSRGFYDLWNLPQYFRQADIALEFANKEHQTNWYSEFEAYVLRYWLTHGTSQMSARGIGAEELDILQAYDEENATDLYETLRVYLTCERKSTLTAQELDIHRSTLPHRLERIEELTHLDCENPYVRLYLLMSYAIRDAKLVPEEIN